MVRENLRYKEIPPPLFLQNEKDILSDVLFVLERSVHYGCTYFKFLFAVLMEEISSFLISMH